jgi:hypothetical protein
MNTTCIDLIKSASCFRLKSHPFKYYRLKSLSQKIVTLGVIEIECDGDTFEIRTHQGNFEYEIRKINDQTNKWEEAQANLVFTIELLSKRSSYEELINSCNSLLAKEESLCDKFITFCNSRDFGISLGEDGWIMPKLENESVDSREINKRKFTDLVEIFIKEVKRDPFSLPVSITHLRILKKKIESISMKAYEQIKDATFESPTYLFNCLNSLPLDKDITIHADMYSQIDLELSNTPKLTKSFDSSAIKYAQNPSIHTDHMTWLILHAFVIRYQHALTHPTQRSFLGNLLKRRKKRLEKNYQRMISLLQSKCFVVSDLKLLLQHSLDLGSDVPLDFLTLVSFLSINVIQVNPQWSKALSEHKL